jgi:hypothetical protein
MAEGKGEARKLLLVLGSGVVAACLVAAFFVLHYGPSGRYLLSRVLLEPDILSKLNYNDYDPKTGANDRFVFDQIAVEYHDHASKKLQKRTIDVGTYAEIYAVLHADRGIGDPDQKIETYFGQEPKVKLQISVRTESSAKWQAIAKVFQEVQFAEQGDYYRVELHEQQAGAHWVYFHHPHVSQDVSELLKI